MSSYDKDYARRVPPWLPCPSSVVLVLLPALSIFLLPALGIFACPIAAADRHCGMDNMRVAIQIRSGE